MTPTTPPKAEPDFAALIKRGEEGFPVMKWADSEGLRDLAKWLHDALAALRIAAGRPAAPQPEGEPTRSEVEALVEKLDGLHTKTCSRAALMISQLAIGRAVSRTRIAELEAALRKLAIYDESNFLGNAWCQCELCDGTGDTRETVLHAPDCILAALTPTVASAKAEEGHVLVPIEPTPEMVEAGRAQMRDGGKMETHARIMWIWEAMVAAAPRAAAPSKLEMG